MSQAQFADALELSRPGYALVETGKRRPSPELLAMVHSVFGIFPDQIMLGVGAHGADDMVASTDVEPVVGDPARIGALKEIDGAMRRGEIGAETVHHLLVAAGYGRAELVREVLLLIGRDNVTAEELQAALVHLKKVRNELVHGRPPKKK